MVQAATTLGDPLSFIKLNARYAAVDVHAEVLRRRADSARCARRAWRAVARARANPGSHGDRTSRR